MTRLKEFAGARGRDDLCGRGFLSLLKDSNAVPPVVISVDEAGLALSLEIALKAHGLEVVIHDADDGLSSLPLEQTSTLIVDGHVLPKDPSRFLNILRLQTWRGRLIVLTEDKPDPGLARLRDSGAILIEKPFGPAQLMAVLDDL